MIETIIIRDSVKFLASKLTWLHVAQLLSVVPRQKDQAPLPRQFSTFEGDGTVTGNATSLEDPGACKVITAS